jgi:uncharacterized protein (TIGR02271 family)
MQNEMTLERLQEMNGQPVMDSAGQQIGKVEEIFVDDQSGQPEWVGIGTGFLGTKRVLVPVQGASMSDGGLTVGYDTEKVKGSPDIDGDHISEQTEQELYAYYGLGGAPQPQPLGQSNEGGTVTRHEEELAVGTQSVETGHARLRKWVESEPVEMNVELQRETARITREQIDQPASGDAEFSEEEIDVPLHAEQPVVAKQTVAKERIGIETDVETEQATVTDEVRKEHVDLEPGA